MAEQEAKDNAAKARIINHMNEDHHESVRLRHISRFLLALTQYKIVRYLEHFCKLPSWQAYDGRMSSISLNSMTFVCGGKNHHIPLDPPMASYRDARERAVQMDKESLAGLGRSDVTINEYTFPTGLHLLVDIGIVAATIYLSQRWWFAQDQVVHRLLGSSFAKFCWTVQPFLIVFIFVMHTGEAIYFMRNKLLKHSVNPRTRLFWQWAFSAYIEGGIAFVRFNQMVNAKRREKEKQKH
jgi:hypothetical protein